MDAALLDTDMLIELLKRKNASSNYMDDKAKSDKR